MKITLTDVYTCNFYSLPSALFLVLYTSAHAYMYSGDAIYSNISELLIGYQLYHGGCAICIDWILCHTHDILLLLIKQNLEYI